LTALTEVDVAGGFEPSVAPVETVSQTLHRLTSYDAAWYRAHRSMPDADWSAPVVDPRVLADLRTDDETRFPWIYKRYAEPLPRVRLPRGLPATTAPAVEVLAGAADIPRGDLDLPGLSRLLYLSAGVEIPALLGQPLDGLLFTCVGVPAYASARGGPPGAPTAVGRVRPARAREWPRCWRQVKGKA
jgi:hypothetical protein